MIPFDDALYHVLHAEIKKTTERIAFTDAVGFVLAEDIFSDVDMPPFDKSAMDGYACISTGLKAPMEEIEIIPAGKIPENKVVPGTCARIMTGAMIPRGADCVVRVEDTHRNGNQVIYTGTGTSDNICRQGEDIVSGALVLQKDALLNPQHIAILASVGAIKPLVYSKPSVAVISTGDELVEPNRVPETGQIRNSNGSQLISQIKQAGAIPWYMGIAPDTPEGLQLIIADALKKAQVILLTGGVSMGDYDYVPQVLTEFDAQIIFQSIAVQPGRPTLFAIRNHQFFFGLPGNPVSSFVQFELLVRPLLSRLSGYSVQPCVRKARLTTDYFRKNSRRMAIVPVHITENDEVTPVEYHGSAHIHAYVSANGMMRVEIGISSLKQGELVDVRQI
ncbi:MAG: molybdopterin molybdotransferase MoeA [Bacteroidales bacterium]|nr:molybdopterin molybdotransferase MoeA [Bacteroidales bacterium]